MFRCQQVTGLLAGTMTHGAGYQFIRMGRNLERSDMTTRILDVGAMTMAGMAEQEELIKNRLWMEVLRSLSAYQMYRQDVRLRIEGQRVIEYLLADTAFPRAVAHCVGEIEHCIQLLPRNKNALRDVRSIRQYISQKNINTLARTNLHEYVDEVQLRLANLHDSIVATWFDQ